MALIESFSNSGLGKGRASFCLECFWGKVICHGHGRPVEDPLADARMALPLPKFLPPPWVQFPEMASSFNYGQGGGFISFLFSPLFGEDSQFD